MNSLNSPAFRPTHLWLPDVEQTELSTPIERAVLSMNSADPRVLIDGLKKTVETSPSGVTYSILRGDNPDEYSDSEALVLFNPFANAATPNMLVRAEFIRRVAGFSDVRDSEGKLKPVIMLASPGLGGSDIRLSREERSELKKGNLGPVARELLTVVRDRDIGQVALLGFSQGADMALASYGIAGSSDLDVHSMAVGDPAGVQERSMVALAGDFFKAGAGDLRQSVKATGLDSQSVALGNGLADFTRFGISAASPINLRIYRALGRDRFVQSIQEILDDGIVGRLVVGYGSSSAISNPQFVEPTLESLYNQYGRDSFITVRVQEGKHTWGDNLGLLAKLYMLAFS